MWLRAVSYRDAATEGETMTSRETLSVTERMIVETR